MIYVLCSHTFRDYDAEEHLSVLLREYAEDKNAEPLHFCQFYELNSRFVRCDVLLDAQWHCTLSDHGLVITHLNGV